MTSRTRKLLGTVFLLVFLSIYALLAMAVAISLNVHTSSKWIELAYYVIAGLAWVVPAAWIISWMSKPDAGGAQPGA